MLVCRGVKVIRCVYNLGYCRDMDLLRGVVVEQIVQRERKLGEEDVVVVHLNEQVRKDTLLIVRKE